MNYITNDNLEVADIEVFEIVEAELKDRQIILR